jgi:hypothetical protein
MNVAIRDRIQNEVRRWASNIDEPGRKKVLRRLTETLDPWTSIDELRAELSLSYEDVAHPITFLNILDMQMANCHHHVLDMLIRRLEDEVKKMDEVQLLIMLQLSIHFFNAAHLRVVPSLIVSKLANIPERYLNFIANNVNLNVSSYSNIASESHDCKISFCLGSPTKSS